MDQMGQETRKDALPRTPAPATFYSLKPKALRRIQGAFACVRSFHAFRAAQDISTGTNEPGWGDPRGSWMVVIGQFR